MPRAAETGPEKRRGEAKARAAPKRAGTTKMRKKHKKCGTKKRTAWREMGDAPAFETDSRASAESKM